MQGRSAAAGAGAAKSHLLRAAPRRYIEAMTRSIPLPRLLAFALAAVLLSAASGLAFAGWIGHGPGILMSLADAGLSWCF